MICTPKKGGFPWFQDVKSRANSGYTYKSELPFYPEYILEEEVHHEEKHVTKVQPTVPVAVKKHQAEPKTNLSKMLSGFKIEE